MDIGKIKEGEVSFYGWIHDYRDLGGLKFILVRDETGIIQVTIAKNKAPEKILKTISKLAPESVVYVKGKAQKNPRVKAGIEVIPERLDLISKSKAELPISITEKAITTGQAKRYEWRCLDLRKLRNQAIFRIQSKLLEGMRDYLLKEGFVQLFTPCLLGIASESGAEVFPVIYFNKKAFLRQDPQLHRQLAIAGGFSKIFDIGPCWRAEKSHTVQHLCEHRVCAVEKAFIKDETETMRIEEQIIVSALKKVKEECPEELERLGIQIKIPSTPFPELRFPAIYQILKKEGKNLPQGEDLDSEAEDILWEYVKKKYSTEFYFINRFPSKVKPFYVMKVDDDPFWARSVDLYFKGIELSSGGQREHRYEKLKETLKEKGIKEAEVAWFTKFFQYGVPPHGGFAIGLERLTQSLLNLKNIRDCALFSRDTDRLVP